MNADILLLMWVAPGVDRATTMLSVPAARLSPAYMEMRTWKRDCYETLCADPVHRWLNFRVAGLPLPARSYPYQELHTLWAAMPRPKTGDKRAAILGAATKTIAEDGIGASTASVAKAAAVAEGSLFRYFPDKDKLLNELYRELKLDMRSAMIAGFPLTGSLRKRMQHIWNAYVTWGMDSPAKRRAMMQLTVSERITDQSRQEGQAGFEAATEAMQQLVAQGKLSGLPPAFASDLLLAMAETTMASMLANPAKAEHYRSAGFEAFWSAAAKK